MRIVIIEPDPSFGGGSEQLSLELGRVLHQRGHELFLIHDFQGSMLAAYDQFVAFRQQLSLAPFGWRTLGASWRRAQRLARAIRNMQADVVFSSNVNFLRLFILARKLSKIPLVFHLGVASPLNYWSQRLAFRSADAGVCPSEHTYRTWQADGWPERSLHVVTNWVDTDRFCPAIDKPAVRRAVGLPRDVPLVCYIGRLQEYKGVEVLLKAFSRVAKAPDQMHLLIVGGDENGRTIEWESRAAELGIDRSRVTFSGRVSNPQTYLAAADVCVVPSLWREPFGLTVIEAMSCAVPPIVSDVGIMPQLVGSTTPSLVVPPGDDEALAHRISDLLRDGERLRALGRELRNRAIRDFSPEPAVARYEDVLSNVVVRVPSGVAHRS